MIQFTTKRKKNTRYKLRRHLTSIKKTHTAHIQKWYGKTPLGKKRAKAAKGDEDDGGAKGKGKKGKGKGKKK